MQNELTQQLSNTKELSLAGGKALSLGNLLRAGFNSLDGFVITTKAFNKMDAELEDAILKAFDRLDAKYVAVRSSAVAEDGKEHAWAGQLDTFLNVSRDELISAIKKSWQATNSKRAKSYAKQMNIKPSKIAVIIQPMIQSKVAGVAFSVHPITKNPDHVVIEAGLGLGEAVVSGEITPDTYIVDKSTGKILEKHISKQTKKLVQGKNSGNEWLKVNKGDVQKLSDTKIKELAIEAAKLEEFYGFPVDVEWMLLGKIYIMQSRPITTL